MNDTKVKNTRMVLSPPPPNPAPHLIGGNHNRNVSMNTRRNKEVTKPVFFIIVNSKSARHQAVVQNFRYILPNASLYQASCERIGMGRSSLYVLQAWLAGNTRTLAIGRVEKPVAGGGITDFPMFPSAPCPRGLRHRSRRFRSEL